MKNHNIAEGKGHRLHWIGFLTVQCNTESCWQRPAIYDDPPRVCADPSHKEWRSKTYVVTGPDHDELVMTDDLCVASAVFAQAVAS